MDRLEARAALEARQAELNDELARLTSVPRDPSASVSFGKRVGDGTTEAVERINLTSTARSLSAMLEEVERALEKLEAGTYGTCEGCGEAIPDERLQTIPWTTLCVACSRSRSGR